MTAPIPTAALSQHVAVLGKTGSGKTSTAKLIIEHVVSQNARVCVLDPIKSDWWGLISSADGSQPGLPFQILGGPHGHVPLHDGAGAAIGELVANGSLPLSIIDMADFKAGGPVRFFNAFADTLMRKMRGVLYLVVEEAHEFAPKERSGVGEENMAVYYAKKLATAGRTKGIRLIVCSQRVQSLHNAVLGSCETLIVHRFTAPADQEPVWNWLKGNIEDKTERERIRASLRTLKDGQGWICSSAQPLELRQFPRISTFDNTATPTDDAHAPQVRTATIDVGKLRELMGAAVAEAEANDPKMLRKAIADLQEQLETTRNVAPESDQGSIDSAYQAGYRTGQEHGFGSGQQSAYRQFKALREFALGAHHKVINDLIESIQDIAPPELPEWTDAHTENPDAVAFPPGMSMVAQVRGNGTSSLPAHARQIDGRASSSDVGTGGKRRMLIALAQNPGGLTKRKLSILTDISPTGGTWRTYLSELRMQGLIQGNSDRIEITSAGLKALGSFEPLPTGPNLVEYWRSRLGDSGKRAIFDVLVRAGGRTVPKESVSEQTGISLTGGTWRTYLSELRGLGLISGSGGDLCASEELFA